MNHHFKDYYWKNGKPYGKGKCDPSEEITYKIIADPYYKRITLERYQKGRFSKIIYDSLLLDFRHLKAPEQASWQRETLSEGPNQTVCLLKNQDDRAILIESLQFEQNVCRSCKISSIHHIPISTHRMYYKELNDPFDGVILFDNEDRPVMIKTYKIDPISKEFNELCLEEWDMQKKHVLIS